MSKTDESLPQGAAYVRGRVRVARSVVAVVTLLMLWSAVACTGAEELLGAVSTPPPVAVDLLVTESEQFYDVSGGNTEDILRSVELNGPTHFGAQASGTTHSSWDLQWELQQSSSCRISSMLITLDLLVTLPRHSDEAVLEGTALELAANWQRFVEAVRVHEQQHVAIERDRADSTRAEMAQLATLSLECDALRAEVDRIWHDAGARAEALHRTFDQDDRQRIQQLRAPIDLEVGRLEAAIDATDARLTAVNAEIDAIDRELATIRARYPDLVLPEPAYSRHVELTTRRSQLVDEHNVAREQRNAWAAESNALIEQYNWAN